MIRPGVRAPAALSALALIALVTAACASPSTSAAPPSSSPSSAPDTSPSSAPTAPAASSGPSILPGTPFRSARYRYALVIPEGWSVSETPGAGGLHPDEPGVDTFRSGHGLILSVVGEPIAAGTVLATWTCAINQHLSGEHDTTAESTEVLELPGGTARLTRYHLRFDPYVVFYLNAELVDGPIGLTLSMESTTHDDPADEAVFRALLASLTLAG